MEVVWTALGSLFAGGLLVWSVFSFVVDKRDKSSADEKQKFYKDLYDFESRVEAQIKALRVKQDEFEKSFGGFKEQFAVQSERLSNMTSRFMEYSQEMRKIVEKHSEEISQFGKIIRLGK